MWSPGLDTAALHTCSCLASLDWGDSDDGADEGLNQDLDQTLGLGPALEEKPGLDAEETLALGGSGPGFDVESMTRPDSGGTEAYDWRALAASD